MVSVAKERKEDLVRGGFLDPDEKLPPEKKAIRMDLKLVC